MAYNEIKVEGLDELKRALRDLPLNLRKRALRDALAAGARIVRDRARRETPVLSGSDPAVQKGYRRPGTLRRAIVVRTSRVARQAGNVGVFVNVRPARNAVIRGGKVLRAKEKGARSPVDPYYWRWVEFGRQARDGAAARERVARVKVGGKVIVAGVRYKKAQPAVGGRGAAEMLQKGAQELPAALEAFKARLGPAIQRLNVKRAA